MVLRHVDRRKVTNDSVRPFRAELPRTNVVADDQIVHKLKRSFLAADSSLSQAQGQLVRTKILLA